MNTFIWAEIKLPTSYYPPGTRSFAEAFSISPNGQFIVGTFGRRPNAGEDPLAVEFHGFLRQANGVLGLEAFGSYDYPDNAPAVEGVLRQVGSTSTRGINDTGDVVGFYRDQTRGDQIHGYLWLHTEGGPVDYDPAPVAGFPVDLETLHNSVLAIDSPNTGSISRPPVAAAGMFRQTLTKDCGYILHVGGALQVVDLGEFYENVTSTTVSGIRYLDFVGSFTRFGGTPQAETHGYKWQWEPSDNSFDYVPILIDIFIPPNARTLGREVRTGNTMVNGMNIRKCIVGQYDTFETRPDGRNKPTQHGFVWKQDEPVLDIRGRWSRGQHVTIDIAGAKDTVVNGIADDGTFVGYYIDGSSNDTGRHAFVGRLLP
jgi:hypothetical protein